ncbi:hypothetical protein ACFVTY_39315 [Streptomyces sp. NPDC058067]|uniref:hypothetical protein n=1 Tax=Streptomyces sp. NPDC058067 TaxID=3346324 RepID=UPI0036E0A079
MKTVRRTRSTTRRSTRLRYAALGTAVLAALLAGCGIRPTEVPTDFGAAPSRVPCALSGPDLGSRSSGEFSVQVYLVCTSQLVSVDRSVSLPKGPAASDRVRLAQALLDELEQSPAGEERQAGYTTDVRRGTTVSGPADGDPDNALRLSVPPDDLSPYALAQIVCTYANSGASAKHDKVVLGGPAGDALRAYECSPEMRTRPGLVPAPAETVG